MAQVRYIPCLSGDNLTFLTVFQFCNDAQSRIICKVCPKKNGVHCTMELRFIQKHILTEKHSRHTKSFKNGQTSKNRPVFKTDLRQPQQRRMDSDVEVESFGMEGDNGLMDIDSYSVPEADLEVPLSEHLSNIVGSRTYEFDERFTDLFAELQENLASGEIPFSTPLAPINKEDELCDYNAPDFGIDIFGECIRVISLFCTQMRSQTMNLQQKSTLLKTSFLIIPLTPGHHKR